MWALSAIECEDSTPAASARHPVAVGGGAAKAGRLGRDWSRAIRWLAEAIDEHRAAQGGDRAVAAQPRWWLAAPPGDQLGRHRDPSGDPGSGGVRQEPRASQR